jgi:hypothetical protein
MDRRDADSSLELKERMGWEEKDTKEAKTRNNHACASA